MPLLVALTALLAPAVARAQSADAEALIRRGIELRRKGQDEAALQEFQRAYQTAPSPRAAAQIGLAEQALGRWLDADRHLSEAMSAPRDAWVNRRAGTSKRTNREVIAESLETVRAHIGQLEVTGDAGADVFVNGANVGRLPLTAPVRVVAGPVKVEVRTDGRASAAMTVTVAAGQTGQVNLRLEREARAAPPPPPQPTMPKPQVVVVEKPVPVTQPAEPRHGPAARWVALGLTGVAAAVAAGGFLSHESKISDYTKRGCSVDPASGKSVMGDMTSPACDKVLDQASTAKTVGIVGAVSGGVLAITSTLLFFAF